MPRYQYRCGGCNEEALLNHLSDETAEVCPSCGASALTKMLTHFRTAPKPSKKKKTGDIAKEFIKDARSDLKQQKKELIDKR
jgi:putative FmdB family regulatory protein